MCSCAKLVYDKKGSRPQHMRGRRMGTGLRLQSLQSLESSKGASGFYAIIGVEPGMAAYNSRKIHEGDWLESINGTPTAEMDDVRCNPKPVLLLVLRHVFNSVSFAHQHGRISA
jgi:hypothetical protein